MKTLCLILGAGASHDCVVGGETKVKDNRLRPPLTSGLFSIEFDHWFGNFQKASALAAELRVALSNTPGVSLETLLYQEQQKANSLRRQHLRQVPMYLRTLFGEISNGYVKVEQTCYAMLIAKITDQNFEKILVINLNYDTLFEDALHAQLGIRMQNINDYVSPSQKWSVLKPHGSVNWLKAVVDPNFIFSNLENYLDFLDKVEDLKLDERIVIDPRYAAWSKTAGQALYPNMVIPIEDKYNLCCPQQHVEDAKVVLQECNAYCIIGSSLKDRDVIELLKSARNRPVKVFKAVIKNDGKKEVDGFISRAANCFGNSPTVSEVGFSNFIASREVENFLKTIS